VGLYFYYPKCKPFIFCVFVFSVLVFWFCVRGGVWAVAVVGVGGWVGGWACFIFMEISQKWLVVW